MEDVTVACFQPRFSILESEDAFAALARRFLRQAQAKSAALCIFPELTGLMLAPPLVSGVKRGLVAQAARGRRPGAGLFERRVGRIADATAEALGGGLAGSLKRLLGKDSTALRDSFLDTAAGLAREFGMTILAGSLYVVDAESGLARNRAYVFDAGGAVVGWQDKLHLTPEEREIAAPGSELRVFGTKFGRLGILIGQDALYPELARLLAVQGADLLVGIAACPGAAGARVVRTALALRAEENQVYSAASFLLGPIYLGGQKRGDYAGQSALLAPAALSTKGDGVLIQAGSPYSEAVISATLRGAPLDQLRAASDFRPRREMNLAGMGTVLAEIYSRGLSLEQAIEQKLAGPREAGPTQVPGETLTPESAPEDPSARDTARKPVEE